MEKEDIKQLLPRDKFDVQRAEAFVRHGYPGVAPLIGDALVWLQDFNWPVARIIAPFLASVGVPVAPHIEIILGSDDNVWKYWILTGVVARSRDLAEELKVHLHRLAEKPTAGERNEDVDAVARSILEEIGAKP